MSLFSKGNPYRDAPEERVIVMKYPTIKIHGDGQRLVQTADDRYVVEKMYEATDSFGVKTRYWMQDSFISNKSEDRFESTKVHPDVVLWILKNL